MRKIKEVLRHHYETGLSQSDSGKVCRVSRSTVQEYLLRFNASKYSWPLPEGMTDDELERALFPGYVGRKQDHEILNYEYLLAELKKPNVTKEVLWTEYKQETPDGYQYSYFCELLAKYRKTLQVSMRQEHKAGEKGFLDFGDGLKLVNPETGEKIPTKIFVLVWGASQYTYVQATLSEDLPSWIEVNTKAMEYFGCCPKACVPDNLKSAVSKACRYEPDINPTYADFARHYGTAILPARPYRPKDKSLAETGVRLAKRWILARLRNRIFTNLAALNQAIEELLEQLNGRPLRKLNKSRKELFETLDKPNALSLPAQRYEFAEWKKARVNVNYHISFDQHDYSVPYTLIGQIIEVRATCHTVEIIKSGQCVCSHQRSYRSHHYTTVSSHMPPAHKKYLEWTPQRILNWAEKYGPAVKVLTQKIMAQRHHPEQAFKACLGIIRLEKHYSAQRLNAACQRAIDYKIYTYKGVHNILQKNLDQIGLETTSTKPAIRHENIRGADYYAQNMERERESLQVQAFDDSLIDLMGQN